MVTIIVISLSCFRSKKETQHTYLGMIPFNISKIFTSNWLEFCKQIISISLFF